MAYEDDVLISGWDYPSDCVNRKRLSQNKFQERKTYEISLEKSPYFALSYKEIRLKIRGHSYTSTYRLC